MPVIGAVSWLSFKSRRTSSDTSQFIEAAEEVAAAARALAKKITVAQPDGTGVDSVNARAATATSSAAVAAAVAAEAVAVALAAPETENQTLEPCDVGTKIAPLIEMDRALREFP